MQPGVSGSGLLEYLLKIFGYFLFNTHAKLLSARYRALAELISMGLLWAAACLAAGGSTAATAPLPNTPLSSAREIWAEVDSFLLRHRCHHAYVDAGLNIGVQIRKLYEPHKYINASSLAVFDRLFGPPPRCNVCAIGIEPNPRHRARLEKVEQHLRAAGAPVLILSAAAANFDGVLPFGTDSSAGNSNTEDWEGTTAPWVKSKSKSAATMQVPVIDLAVLLTRVRERLAERARPARLLMKLDVEGSEYIILPHLAYTGALCHVDEIYTEWHPGSTPSATGEAVAAVVQRELTRLLAPPHSQPPCCTTLSVEDDESYLHDNVCGARRGIAPLTSHRCPQVPFPARGELCSAGAVRDHTDADRPSRHGSSRPRCEPLESTEPHPTKIAVALTTLVAPLACGRRGMCRVMGRVSGMDGEKAALWLVLGIIIALAAIRLCRRARATTASPAAVLLYASPTEAASRADAEHRASGRGAVVTMRKVFTCLMLGGTEVDFLALHLNATAPHTTAWIVTEAPLTLSGTPRRLHDEVFAPGSPLRRQYGARLHRLVVHDLPWKLDLRGCAGCKLGPQQAFQNEAWQRAACMTVLRTLRPGPEDYVLVADPDEIPAPSQFRALATYGSSVVTLGLRMFYYDLGCYRGMWDKLNAITWGYAMRASSGDPSGWAQAVRNANYTRPVSRAARLHGSPGYHLSYFLTAEGVAGKISHFGEQHLNTPAATNVASLRLRIAAGCDPVMRRDHGFVCKSPPRDDGTTWMRALIAHHLPGEVAERGDARLLRVAADEAVQPVELAEQSRPWRTHEPGNSPFCGLGGLRGWQLVRNSVLGCAKTVSAVPKWLKESRTLCTRLREDAELVRCKRPPLPLVSRRRACTPAPAPPPRAPPSSLTVPARARLPGVRL